MQKFKKIVTRRRVSVARIAVIAVGFVLFLHFNHWRYSQHSSKYSFYNNLKPINHVLADKADQAEEFHATAYCISGITKSGVPTAPGRVASDPEVIPLGSMIYIDSPVMGGIYQVFDTGRLVKGKIIDIFIPDYDLCRKFGRRNVKVKVLRYGFLGYPPGDEASK